VPWLLPGVEDVIAGQLLGPGDHFLTADDADVVQGLQVCRSSVGVPGGAPREMLSTCALTTRPEDITTWGT